MTLRGGMQTLADTIVQKLGSNVIQPETKVISVVPSPSPAALWQVRLAGGETLTADAVCLALPSYAAADLLRAVDFELANDLSGIGYAPASTLNFALRAADVKHPLNGVGFVVPHKENKLVLGCTFAGNKFEGRAPEGHVLLRAFLGGVQSRAWTEENDRALTDQVFAELKGWLGIVGEPLFTHVERYAQALPQYAVGHLERMMRIEERTLRYKGLALAGNWSYGIGIPDCIESGERAAEQIISYLERPEPVVP